MSPTLTVPEPSSSALPLSAFTRVWLSLVTGVTTVTVHTPAPPAGHSGLVAVDASHLFESNTTRLAIRRGSYLRRYDYALIELFAPHLTRRVVEMALSGGGAEYQL